MPKILALLWVAALAAGCQNATKTSDAPKPPNILWITAEDMSPTLGCYGDTYAITPNIDALATQSIRYTHAFATAPVCSPSRSCLINGAYAQSQGTHQMRSAFPIPKAMTGFPSILRDAGFYASNNVKTDYNSANWQTIIRRSWDETSPSAHWRNGKDGKPFFSVFNLMTSHQSRAMVWPYARFQKEVQSRLEPGQIHDPAKAPLPPYYPDSMVIRKTVARFYDCVTAMDAEVGQILKQLEVDGLADDTIVFFYSDHGSGMPRHKRALLDSGMHVPLLVRFGKNVAHLAPASPGTTTDRLVSFVDFGPTVLSLTNQKIPIDMQGLPFLGKQSASPRGYVYGHRDRVDEVIDMARSVRDKRYLYIRNYMPHLGYNQRTAWPDLGEIRHEFYRLTDRATMSPAQWHFAGPTRPVEELYDCAEDPMNLRNLAKEPAHAKTLSRLRGAMSQHLTTSKDLGFLPEALQWKLSGASTPWEMARRGGGYNQARLITAASKVGVADEKDILVSLKSTDAGVRYWGAVGLAARKNLSANAATALTAALEDPSVTVRIEAANALARHGQADKAVPVLAKALEAKNLAAVLHAARTIELLGPTAQAAVPAVKAVDQRMLAIRPPDTPATVVQPGEKDMAMFIGFSTQAFLRRFAK